MEKIKLEQLITDKIKFKPTAKFVAPKVVEDYKNINEAEFPTQEELINKLIGITNIKGDPDGIEILPEEIVTDNKNNTVTEIQKPYTWVEEMPNFSNGDQDLMKFLVKNIQYPEIAIRAGIEGKVILQFTVEQDGFLSDIIVAKGIGAGCDEEAVRVLKLTGKWNPGKQNRNPVRVRMNIPFVFNLQ
jgi:protein TonB